MARSSNEEVQRHAVVEVARTQLLKFKGHGDPEQTPLIRNGFQGLCSVASTIRFTIKACEEVA